MTKITIKVMWEFLYFYGINFDILLHTARIVFAALYIVIMILATMLNFTILYVFITKKKLRRPSNVVLSPLIWISLILLLTILPLTLRTNRNSAAVHSYPTFLYIILPMLSILV